MKPAPGTRALPQLQGRPMVTDGGLETDLIFHHGVDLPHFAAFPLLGSDRGRALLARLRDRYATSVTGIVVSGMVGPREDGYQPGQAASPDDAAAYHRPQVDAFARAGADMVSAFTLTSTTGAGRARTLAQPPPGSPLQRLRQEP